METLELEMKISKEEIEHALFKNIFDCYNKLVMMIRDKKLIPIDEEAEKELYHSVTFQFLE